MYYQKADGHWAMLISYISYRPTVAGTMVPELTGVMEFNRFGFFSNHSVSNAVKKFPGAVLFPPELGRQYAQAFAHWHEGLFSVVFDEYIDELSEQVKLVARNHMPYVQSYQDIGLVEVAAIEPSGEGKYALRGLLFFDAGSGKPHFWTPAQVDGYIGPRRAEDNVVAGEPEINWRNYHLVEPRVLVSSDRDLYYLFTMVQDDGSNHAVAKFFLENASTLKTYPFSTAQEVRDFLDGKQQAGL